MPELALRLIASSAPQDPNVPLFETMNECSDVEVSPCPVSADRHPLTLAQQAIWVDQIMRPEVPLYVISAVLHGCGFLSVTRLQEALDRVVRTHTALRTRIEVDVVGVPTQRVFAHVACNFEIVAPSCATSDDGWLKRELSEIAVRQIELERTPLWEAILLQSSNECWSFVFRIHHIVCDGVGLDLILRDLESAYNETDADRRYAIQSAPSFLDAIAEEADYLRSVHYERDRKFWDTEHVSLEPALLDQNQMGEYGVNARSDQCWLELPRSQVAALNVAACTAGGTFSHLLIAVIAAYFARVSGRSDIVIGLAVHNRHGSRQKRMVGMFSSVLPLRINVDVNANLDDLIRVVAGKVRQCFRHQRFSMTSLNRRLRPQNHGRDQIYDVSFSFEPFGGGYRFGDATATLQALDHGHEPLPLAISVRDYDPGQPMMIAFNHHLTSFSTGNARALVAKLQDAFIRIAASPEVRIADLPLVTSEERAVLLGFSVCHGASNAVPSPGYVHERVAAHAVTQSEALAMVGCGLSLRYGELNARANQVAHALLTMGVRPDDRVGLCVRRGPALLVGLLGIHKAGAAYLPLDPDYPLQRLQYMLKDAEPVVVVSESDLDSIGSGLSIPRLLLDDTARLAEQPDHDPVVLGLLPHHLAYVIYTSGSTGAPKGVMVEHAQLMQQVETHIAQCNLTRADRMLQFASISFDSAVVEIFPTLAAGATLVLREAPMRIPDADFVAHLDQHRVTVTDLPTAFWAQWAQQMAAGQSRPGLAQRLVVVGGEKVERRHLQSWLSAEVTRHCRWLNTYGPTEATVYATAYGVDGGASCPQGEISIGRPTGHSRIYVLDRCGKLLPPGAIGEICVGGAGVARGYLRRPELTAERFIADSLSANDDARLYRTGDLGRWRGDGQLEFHGRSDHQVKLRGFRIELGEIEAALATHEHVREAVVVVRGEGPAARLVAYVVGNEAAAPLDASALRMFLSERLVEHMLPSVYVSLAAFPLTANGKIDHAALPATEMSALPGRVHVAPQTPLEQTLANLWQELLEVERVGREDNFFELGGHSLLVVSLVERLRQRGIASDVRTLFSARNLAALAEALDMSLVEGAGRAPSNLIPRDATAITPEMLSMLSLDQVEIDTLCEEVQGGAANIQDMYPLAPLQEGMLFHHLLDGEGDAYLMHTVLVFDERMHLDQFVQALQHVIDRHDVFRTSVHWRGLQQPVQVVHRSARLPVFEQTPVGGEALAQLLTSTDPGRIRIDLHNAPLMAVHVIADPAHGRWLLALLEHHIVCDHVTLELMINEVGLILQGRHADLAEPWPYRHFIAHTLATPASVHENYFRIQLGDVIETTAPFGVLDVHAVNEDSEEAIIPLDTTLSRQLRERAHGEGLSPSVLFHLAWALVVARCSGRDEAVFGTVLAGRSQGSAGADRAMGLFLNTLPVRIPLQNCSVHDALQDTHHRLIELLAHEQAPLAMAQRCSGVSAAQPLFTSMFNYRHSSIATINNQNDDGIRIRDWNGMRVLRVNERTNYPLSASIDDGGENFVITVHAVNSIGASRIAEMLAHTMRMLTVAKKNDSLVDLDVLPACERARLQDLAGHFAPHDWREAFVHQLFERQARERPDSIAIIAGDAMLCYGELECRANRLALVLQQQAVGVGDLVALHLPRGIDLVVAMLAVWKAGAAYLPVDPEYPAQRRSFMLDDSRVRLVIATRHEDAELRGLNVRQAFTVLTPDVDDPRIDASARVPSRSRLEQLAYVIYTSGSTGTPKGVMVTHRGLANMLRASVEQFGVDADSGILQFASSSFDASVYEIGMALCVGAALHILPRDQLLPGDPLIAALAKQGITHATLPSSALAACGEAAVSEIPAGKLTLILAGDVLPSFLVQRWAQWQTLFNAYGPTETTVCATIHRCGTNERGIIPIGKPLPNTCIYLLDPRGQALPHGAIGEIYIGGLGVADGYLNRPELTAERFVVDPFSAGANARLYRTGDLGRWREDGQLEFHGRNDQQIKLRGFRVETGEIESALMEHAGVRSAVVTVTGEGIARRLVAYVVARDIRRAPDLRGLRAHLESRLPEYMLPSAFVFIEELPVTPNGKVDRKALPAPDDDALVRGDYLPPIGDVECALAEIWSELLKVQRVGRDDDFAELGGHSLLVMQLATRIRDQFAVEVPLRELFERSAFRDQSGLIVNAQLQVYADADLSALKDELGGMSEAELRALLMEEVSDDK